VWIAVGCRRRASRCCSLQGFAIGGGEALTLASAFLYAVHIVGLGVWSSSRSALGLTVVQLLTITVVCGAAAAPGGVVLPQTGGDWFALVYMALVAGAAALVVQTWAQAHLTATRAAIIMTMEPSGPASSRCCSAASAWACGSCSAAAWCWRRCTWWSSARAPEEQDVAQEVGGVTHVGPV
jgi:hypothetical protein